MTQARRPGRGRGVPFRLSRRTRPLEESVTREMTRSGAEIGHINLARGLPDLEPREEGLEARGGARTRARLNLARREETLRRAARLLTDAHPRGPTRARRRTVSG